MHVLGLLVVRAATKIGMVMNAVFYVSASLMLLVALSFASAPLLRRRKAASAGLANIPLLAVIAALLLAVGLYAAIGRPGVASSPGIAAPRSAAMTATSSDNGRKAASVSTLLDGLEARLQDDPEDARGWLLLAKSYDHLGRTEEAAMAYGKAAALGLTDDVLEARLR